MHFNQTYNRAPTRLCVLDIETLAPPALDGTFPPWPSHRPLCASLLVADQVPYGRWEFAIESVTFDDERAAITRIDQLMDGRRTTTFNGKGFDLPVLLMTAARASLYKCRNLTDAWASKRYSGSHVDVADLASSYGAAPRVSLEMLCQAAGIPVKTNGSGADVATMLEEEGIESVIQYCEEDVASTLVLFAMLQGLVSNDAAYSASLIGDFVNWVGDAGLEHLEAFQQLSGNAVLERTRLLHRVREGVRQLDDRTTARYFEEQAGSSMKSHQKPAG